MSLFFMYISFCLRILTKCNFDDSVVPAKLEVCNFYPLIELNRKLWKQIFAKFHIGVSLMLQNVGRVIFLCLLLHNYLSKSFYQNKIVEVSQFNAFT
jgi:hypothetical protein